MEPFYYTKMTRDEQAAYRALLDCLLAQRTECPVPALTRRALSDVFFRLRLDHPEIFWAVTFRYRTEPGADRITVLPEYLFDPAKVRAHHRALQSRVEKLARPMLGAPPLEQERYIHDLLCGSVRYDKLKKPYSHEIIGPLGHGVGVCEGIAKSVKVLCDAIGLWCIIAHCGNNPAKGIKYQHTWNIVRLDGTYYHLDVTFDNTLSAESGGARLLRYDYFNLDDKQVFRDHEPLIAPAPACTDGTRTYYRTQKLSFTKPEEAENRARQAAKKGKPLVFQWRGGPLTGETLTMLVELLRRAGEERQKQAVIRINRPQGVLAVRYEAGAAASVTEQEANEGETLPEA